MINHRTLHSILSILFILTLAACNLPSSTVAPSAAPVVPPAAITSTDTPPAPAPATDSPVPSETPVAYYTMPGDPLTVVSKLTDPVFPSNTGDNYPTNLYERPFQLDNTYRPDADIKFAFLADDGDWYYFSTQLVDINPADKQMDTPYGIEIDVDRDGRGDFLLWATPPYSMAWTKTNIQLRQDSNNDVGGLHPLASDAPIHGDGYETVLFDGGKGTDIDAAWVRWDPKDPTYLQIAVKKTSIGAKSFLWNPWMDFGVKDPTQFDYNDFYTAQEAGSPYAANPNFPPKKLFGLDNTCRAAYGFTPTGREPGICNAAKPPAATAAPKQPTQPAPPPQAQPGSINGVVYIDNNGNGAQDGGEPGSNAYPLYLFAGACTGSSISSTTPDSNGNYAFPNLSAGTYCVNLFYSGSPVKPGNPQTISVSAGGGTTVNFGIVPPG